jgi:hypothetical protein
LLLALGSQSTVLLPLLLLLPWLLSLLPHWPAVIHGIVAWIDAYGIGANDVANAFGTSVGESGC